MMFNSVANVTNDFTHGNSPCEIAPVIIDGSLPSIQQTPRMVKIGKESYQANPFGPTWCEILAAYISENFASKGTRAVYGRSLVTYFKWIDSTGRSLPKMTRADMADYLEYMEVRKLSPRTMVLYINALHSFYGWASSIIINRQEMDGRIYSVPLLEDITRGLRRPLKDESKLFAKSGLTAEQGSRLLQYFQTYHTRREVENGGKEGGRTEKENEDRREFIRRRNYAMVYLLLHNGLRSIEIHRMDVGDLESYGNGRYRLMIQGKGHTSKDNFVVVTQKTYDVLQDYLSLRPGILSTAPMFKCIGSDEEDSRLSTRTIQSIVKDGMRACGFCSLPPGQEYDAELARKRDHLYSTHSLRHTTGQRLMANGASLVQIQTALRHANPGTTEIYLRQEMIRQRLENPPEKLLDDDFDVDNQTEKSL